MTLSARNRMWTPGFDISRRCYNATMATWIWRWRRTMLEKAPWIARMVSRPFAKLATTCKRYRMLISAQARDAWKACGAIRAQSVRNPIRAAELFSQTSEASRFSEFRNGVRAAGALQGIRARKAGMLAGQNFFHKLFARVSPVFLASALAFSWAHTSLAREDSEARTNADRREAASAQFARAENLRTELNSKPIEKRDLS